MKCNHKRIVFIISFFCAIALLYVVFLYVSYQFQPYNYYNFELYIYKIEKEQLLVKALPNVNKNRPLSGSYTISINNSLRILDMEGKEADLSTLKVGDILVFDYTGRKDYNPPEGTVLNSERKGIYNIRLSDEIFNYKFWGIELE